MDSIIETQVSFFFRDDLDSLDLFLEDIRNRYEDVKHIVLPENTPKDLPRLIMENNDFVITVFLNRLHIKYSSDLQENKTIEVLSCLLRFQNQDAHITRVGLVKSYFIEDKDINSLKNLFLPRLFSTFKVKEINTRINILDHLQNINFNNIETVSVGEVNEDGQKKSGVILLKDFNSLKEDTLTKMNVQELMDLIKKMDLKIRDSFILK